MERKKYQTPSVSEGKSALRASILAGSTFDNTPEGGAIGGVSGGSVGGNDFTFGTRKRIGTAE